ncbi:MULTISPECIES: EamA family transporter RarD [Acinetobacter]|jgi:chloramphenicol-sensitive protein RarD|uniref:EamA family transporter RarD n=1 Tax=Acinetobacter TaxID=469 RepID=UPI000C5D86EC|nr:MULTISPECIES: EamA family transporter RarD [Acinetobacter]MBC70076.1 protein RarD [Acinetobacter sp.]MBT50892.1 protein RarD [Acinetobacter sp.]HIQ33491.1 EamA family transporter RarD [Acinetobacter venetianus]HJP48115.1 EamA family transporter RarD [Acinetobacter venetianus]|tara:strand:+ start:546 stop:1445 length:900 start_codon:yes stop_codon:yes gene_type:complete
MHTQSNTVLGITFNVIASLLFALMFAYTTLLHSLQGNEIYGWRILLTLPCLTLFIIVQGNWSQVITIYKRLHNERYFFLTRFLSSFLIGIQLWLFMWAPSNGYGLDVSLGYFIMPITMVILGRIAFKDKMSRLQKLSCFFAILGIINMLVISKTLTWPTLFICLGYPVYFWLRQKTNTNNIGGVWFDMVFSLPISFFFILQGGVFLGELGSIFDTLWLILGLGLISALALGFQSLSAPHLNLSLFGLLVYVEPVLLLMVSILLGETIKPAEWPTYIGIWLAVCALVAEGIISLRKKRFV